MTLEMWNFACVGMCKDMIDHKELTLQGIQDFLKYVQDINRLASKYV